MLLCAEAWIATHTDTVDAYFTDGEAVPGHVVNCGKEMARSMLCVLLAACTFEPAAPLAARYVCDRIREYVCPVTHPYTAIALVLGETDLVQGNQHTR